MQPRPYNLSVMKELSQQRCMVFKQLGDCYVNMGEFEKAGNCFQRAISLRPELHEAYLALGMLAVHANQFDLGKQALERAVEISPTCAEAYGGLAVMFQRQEEYSSAFDMYLKSLDLDSDNLLALLGLFQTSCRMESFEEIIHFLEVYLEKHPDDASVLFCLATLHAKEGRLCEAVEVLDHLLTVEPEKTEALDLLGKINSMLQTA